MSNFFSQSPFTSTITITNHIFCIFFNLPRVIPTATQLARRWSVSAISFVLPEGKSSYLQTAILAGKRSVLAAHVMAVQISADQLFTTAIWTYNNAEFAFLVVLLFLTMRTLPSATFIQAFDLYLADHAKYYGISSQFVCSKGF